MKTDLRIQKSKTALQNSFIDLLNKNKFSKITVDQICKNASVNRMTFYNHYKDKYDLFEDIIEQLRINVIAKFNEYAKNDFSILNIPNLLYRISELVIDECIKYQNIILLIIHDTQASLIQYMISNALNNSIVKVLQTFSFNDQKYNKISLMASFLTGGISSLIVHWLENGDSYHRDELNNLIQEFISHSYQILLA